MAGEPLYSQEWGALEPLRQRFLNPEESTKPRCYWYWLDDHISKEGITRDLESMKRVGIGAAYIGHIGGSQGKRTQLKPAPMSEAWWELMEHAVREGTRIGVDLGIFNCPGWSQSGGPWVKPEQTMRFLVSSETRVQGPRNAPIALTTPKGPTGGLIQTVSVLAYPAPEGDDIRAREVTRQGNRIEFQSDPGMIARSLIMRLHEVSDARAVLSASTDGKNFRNVREFRIARTTTKLGLGPDSLAPLSLAFNPTQAVSFRLEFKPGKLPFNVTQTIGDVEISPALRLEDLAGKALMKSHESAVPPFSTYRWPPQAAADRPELVINPSLTLDVSRHLDKKGQLNWKAPPGKWIIQWTAMAATGTTNKPAPIGALGPEVDKMNRQHVQHHLDSFLGVFLKRLSPKERKSWKYIVADSYETGLQNWTDGMRVDFQRVYGYDPQPYLPVIAGRVVSSVEQSERFLWDLRRLVAERVAYDYVGTLRKWSNARNLKLWLENYGHFGFPSEFLLYGSQSDEISGEFWLGSDLGNVEVRSAASACHIYGHKRVWAEAFTSGRVPFQHAPRDLKARGDWAFCQGINQFVFHVSIHQPGDTQPGINAWFGTEFNRHNPWFEKSQSWIEYLRRCSVMLQTGLPVADFAVFITEDTPKMVGPSEPAIPAGHDFDEVNSDVLLHRMTVRDGKLVLPDGTSYSALVLPDSSSMRPAVARKIRALADAGANIVGSKPDRSPSLQGFPACDGEVRQIATWKSFPTPADVGLQPDVIAPAGLLWKHRRANEVEIYFISNQKPESRNETVSFRVSGLPAALWNPVNSSTSPIHHLESAGRSEINLQLPPNGSVFVVFCKHIPKAIQASQESMTQEIQIPGPWTAQFPDREISFRELSSWTQLDDPQLRHHSGSVKYRTEFEIPEKFHNPVLDLGRVESIAQVRINGVAYPTLWTEPYKLPVANSLHPGKNLLEVEVTHTWNNRLIGNIIENKTPGTGLPLFSPRNPKALLQPSGLLGPVRLLQMK